ncbi:MAG: short-chain dehydrogenase [Gammaproteobacteria bacterium]|nr:short-chain dehydrogenase [Gammaproteobacteria bacterium]
MADESILIIGANSGIAGSLIENFLDKKTVGKILAVSRSMPKNQSFHKNENIEWLLSDYTEHSIDQIVSTLKTREFIIDKVIICNGALHSSLFSPEKRVEDIELQNLDAVMKINAFIPMLWVKNLKPLIRKSDRCSITVFSARIGSIQDNGKGGWYAYRASKAALNMLMKTASIEFRRESAEISFLLFHPGTTDTYLSQPFQKRMADSAIFQTDFVAKQLIIILDNLVYDGEIKFADWKGETIAW